MIKKSVLLAGAGLVLVAGIVSARSISNQTPQISLPPSPSPSPTPSPSPAPSLPHSPSPLLSPSPSPSPSPPPSPVGFFSPATRPANWTHEDNPAFLKERFVTVNVGLLKQALIEANNDHTKKVRFDLFDDVVVDVSTDSFSSYDDLLRWSGANWDSKLNAYVTIFISKPKPEAADQSLKVDGEFQTEQYITLKLASGQTYVITESDPRKMPEPG